MMVDGINHPQISVVVVIFRMAAQARNTLLSLSTTYQTNVSGSDYEVIVVENASDRLLGREAVQGYGPNFRYFLREDDDVSPANAVNFGVSMAKHPIVGVLVDGARLLTPGVLQYSLMAFRTTPEAVVSVPGFHLGDQIQQESSKLGYDERSETALLESIHWPKHGYRLFEIACFSGSCVRGYFRPFSESNCIFVSRRLWDHSGGCDPRFDLPGGGFVNLDLYKRLCESTEAPLFLLFGEGTFHQYHGGVTTSGTQPEERETYMQKARTQYQMLRGTQYTPPATQPVFLGSLSEAALPFLSHSVDHWERAVQPSKRRS